MEKRWNTLGWMILGLLGLLLAGQVFSGIEHRDPDTVTARRYAGPEPVWVRGVVIRQEIPLQAGPGGAWTPSVPDGTRVAAGQALWQMETRAEPDPEQVRFEVSAWTLPARRTRLREVIGELGGADSPDRLRLTRELTALLLAEGGNNAPAESAPSRQTGPEITAPASGVFAAVSDPLGVELVDSLEAPGANITGTSDFLNTNAVLDLIFAANPDAQTVGLLYDVGQDASTTPIADAKAYLDAIAAMGCDYNRDIKPRLGKVGDKQ